jgi:hypothetical protein
VSTSEERFAAAQDFDTCVGIDAASMDNIGAAIFTAYPQLFNGRGTATEHGISVTVSWKVRTKPRFVLAIPINGRALLRAHAMKWTPPEGLDKADAIEMVAAQLEATVFQMILDTVDITIEGTPPATDTATVTVFLQVETLGKTTTIKPLKAIGKSEHPDDDYILNELILPAALKMATTIADGFTVPPLDLIGVSLTPPVARVQDNRLMMFSNLAGKSMPAGPFTGPWPDKPFFLLLSDYARLQVAIAATHNFSLPLQDSGSLNLAIATVYYSASALVSQVQVAAEGGGSPRLAFGASLYGNVNAGLTIACTRIGVNYDLKPAHPLNGVITLSIASGHKVRGTVTQLAKLVLLLIPQGNVAEKILSAITYPITQALTAAFSPVITNALEGIAFDLWDVQAIHLAIGGVSLAIAPANLTIANAGSYLAIHGDIQVSASDAAVAAALVPTNAKAGRIPRVLLGNGDIGPIVKMLLQQKVWPMLFTPGTELYMPDLILNGNATLGVAPYDPYPRDPNESLGPLTGPTIGEEFPEACTILPENPPVMATGEAGVTLTKVRLKNLHYVSAAGPLAFPGGRVIDGTSVIGTLPDGTKGPLTFTGRYDFNQPCRRLDTGLDYVSNGVGDFVCELPTCSFIASLTLSEQLVVHFTKMVMSVPKEGQDMPVFTVTPDGDQPQFIKDFIKAAAQAALATNVALIIDFLNVFINDPSVHHDLDTIVNTAIKKVLGNAGLLA